MDTANLYVPDFQARFIYALWEFKVKIYLESQKSIENIKDNKAIE